MHFLLSWLFSSCAFAVVFVPSDVAGTLKVLVAGALIAIVAGGGAF